MAAVKKMITRYLRNLSPAHLGVRDINSIEILEMVSGSYNLNYRVRVSQKEFIFRINIEQQSGLSNQIEYEFGVLKFLENHHIAPKAYHFDDSKRYFDFDILIEEYLKGPQLSLEKEYLVEVAELLARLHALEPRDMPFVVWRDPLVGIYELTSSELACYEAKTSPDKKTISLAKKVLSNAGKEIGKHQHLFCADALNHTDLCCENFVRTTRGLKLIDWEKPLVDDCAYDVCCFLCEPVELYNSEKILNPEERVYFLDIYARFSGNNPDYLMNKVKILNPLISLHWILWAATMICDFSERRTSPELTGAHEDKIIRYQRVAHVENIENLLAPL